MGGSVSFLEAEKKTWIWHTLHYDENAREASRKTLATPGCFAVGKYAWLGRTLSTHCGVSFHHWFVSDGTYFIEFGSANLSIYSALVNINTLCRHEYEKIQRSECLIDEIMRRRMDQIVGLSNYSLCLRNCEHVANYVLYGRWTSSQMESGGLLMNIFRDYMMSDQKRLVNTFPVDIRIRALNNKVNASGDQIYSFLQPYYVPTQVDYYLDADEPTYNVLIIGPTGAGKSHLINVIFNQVICESRISHIGVTPEIVFIRGQGDITSVSPDNKDQNNRTVVKNRRTVLVIDTIGLCDTRFTDDEIFHLIKGRVSRNFKILHAVIVVLSTDRIISAVETNVKRVLDWLNYRSHPGRFLFVFTKAENTNDALQSELREQAIRKLGLICTERKVIETSVLYSSVVYVGFPRAETCNEAGIEAIRRSYDTLKPLLTLEHRMPPIRLSDAWSCTIL
ncbi:unnamed protein product [Adineta ricciae]|uniref:Uncharacterized protein n=1 Tax=Adineta ricciae TaxID=249248 RepID=A0A815MJL8_ADIRI|nr:unnamed protein product [Adineta ricciae]CAF1586256.1 unnamed protein product [Adineta ricciae]